MPGWQKLHSQPSLNAMSWSQLDQTDHMMAAQAEAVPKAKRNMMLANTDAKAEANGTLICKMIHLSAHGR